MSDSNRSESISPPPPDEAIDQQAERVASASMPPPKDKKKSAPKAADGAQRSRGTTLLPVARVGRIIKADNEVDICSKEANFLICIATEQFIKHFADTGHNYAKAAKRKAIHYHDLSAAVDQRWHLGFLKEIVPTTMPLSAALAQRQRRLEASYHQEAGALEDLLERPDGTIDPQLKAFADKVQTHANIGAGGKKIVNKSKKVSNNDSDETLENGEQIGEGSGSNLNSVTTSRSGRTITTPSRNRGDSLTGLSSSMNKSRNQDGSGGNNGDVEMIDVNHQPREQEKVQQQSEPTPQSTQQNSIEPENGSGGPSSAHPRNSAS